VHIQAYLDSIPGLTSNVNIEHVIVTSEDSLGAIPDGSVDAVVATFVLCSVMRSDLILNEIKRTLAPVNRNKIKESRYRSARNSVYAFLNPAVTGHL
jgi:ubiquinone/menaquinone biosynthesis C-methylase UbiE